MSSWVTQVILGFLPVQPPPPLLTQGFPGDKSRLREYVTGWRGLEGTLHSYRRGARWMQGTGYWTT